MIRTMTVTCSDVAEEKKTFSIQFDDDNVDNRACYMLDCEDKAVAMSDALIAAREACYAFAKCYFENVLASCIELETEDESYERDVRALLSIANTCSDEFFVDIVTKNLFADSCDCDIEIS